MSKLSEEALQAIRKRHYLEDVEPHWWCPRCQEEVPPSWATFEETHDGCGVGLIRRPDQTDHDIRALLAHIEELERENVEFTEVIRTLHEVERRAGKCSGEWRCVRKDGD